MKLTIRFADQIVGLFVIIALGALVFVIFMLGSNQRWFARDYHFITYFDSAAGLSNNMAVQYRGFTIGRVKSFDLAKDDRVEVHFYIFDTYISRVRSGSLVEMVVGPIPVLGNQFLFHPGQGGEDLAEGDLIPNVNSPEGRAMVRNGLASIPPRDDNISLILSRAGTLLDNVNQVMNQVNQVLTQIEDAFAGTNETVLGRTLGDVEMAVADVQEITAGIPGILDSATGSVTGTLESVTATLNAALADLHPILNNLEAFSEKLIDPEGTVYSILDSKGPVYSDLVSSLKSVTGLLQNLERTSAYLPLQMPQIAATVNELRTALEKAQDVLTALTNNPILRNGIPPRVETAPTGTSLRDIDF
ncbi:MAG: MlaD family protein [Treponema sp.]|jgi:phospholipid/cholesterol/gamma-HCH transport system substrate-binding protein|nr:MlaD family protein [Treponema sp.]